MAAAHGDGRGHRLLRADRARRRLRPASMRTRARRDGDDWVLNGRKMWITNGSVADVAVVWAQTDDGVRGFVVPTDTPASRAPRSSTSCRCAPRSPASWSSTTSACRRGRAARGPGPAGAAGCLNEARYGIVWGAMGAARLLEAALRTPATASSSAGRSPGSSSPSRSSPTWPSSAQGRAARPAPRPPQGRRHAPPEQVSFGKLNNVREALEICRTARTILGANGISLEYPVIRHMNNLESVLTYEGTDEMHTLVVGQALTGSPPSADIRNPGRRAEPACAHEELRWARRTNASRVNFRVGSTSSGPEAFWT